MARRKRSAEEKKMREITKEAAKMRTAFFAGKAQEAEEKMRAQGASEEQINEVRRFIAQGASITDDGW